MPSLIGMRLGDFELLAEVGRGGMGVVYKASQLSLDRIVALKMLPIESSIESSRVARFLKEARAIARLSHPNIVAVHQFGETPFGPFIAMQFIEGETLATIIDRGPMPILRATDILLTISGAVHYAHTEGVIHRDLKPANVMIDRFRRPIVMDFGVAKILKTPTGLTSIGGIIGTPSYMSPEQAEEKYDLVGPRSDVYSLGAILYSALTGRPPYLQEGGVLQTILKVISPEMPPQVRSLRAEVPPELARICMTCLTKDPADRYASAHALAEELRRFRPTLTTTTQAPPQKAPAARVLLVEQPSGKRIQIFKSATVLGRARDCDVVLDDPSLSMRHCRVHLEPHKVVVQDLGTASGTFVNGFAVEESPLEEGDDLQIGRHHFRVSLPKPSGL